MGRTELTGNSSSSFLMIHPSLPSCSFASLLLHFITLRASINCLEVIVLMRRLSYPTETVLSKNISRNAGLG